MQSPRYCSWAPDRLLRDPSVRRMGAEPFGGYCSLLTEAWLDPSGSLPCDPVELSLLARMSKTSWAKHQGVILPLFYEEGGRFFSPIIDEARANILKKSQIGRRAVEVREMKRSESCLQLEFKSASDDHRTIIDRSSKEKEKEKEKENPPSTPSGSRKASSGGIGAKALRKGDPKNEETWAQFDAAYPRPSNGRKLERAEARLIWDLLVENDEFIPNIIEGAKEYRTWVETLRKGKFVAMMTTWLNQRRWEESYRIDKYDEEFILATAQKEAQVREERSAHQAQYQKDYDAFLLRLAEAGSNTPEFVTLWKTEVEETTERRRSKGMDAAVRAGMNLLCDVEAGRLDRLTKWTQKNTVPSFWEWDMSENPEGLKT